MAFKNGDGPKHGFFQPGVPVEITPPVIIPLPAAPTRSTIPRALSAAASGKGFTPGTLVNVKPGTVFPQRSLVPNPFKSGPGSSLGPKITPGELKLFSEMHAKERYLKAAKLAKVGPYLTAFQIGWTLGDFLWPEGWYSFVPDAPGAPDQSAGADGWNHPNWTWVPCTFTCATATGPAKFNAGTPPGGLACPGSMANACLVNIMPVSHGHADPEAALAAAGGPNTINVWTTSSTNPTLMHPKGQYPWDGLGDPMDGWVQTTLPGTKLAPAPLGKPRPSEHPETFPLEWPMQMPWPQKWAEAIPAPKTQGQGKHKQQVVGTTLVPRLPLAPFPIVTVVPPGGTVPPPPDQVIDIPPPSPVSERPSPGNSGKPPTYHTRPPHGRRPLGRNTKEKKLSVRSVANKSWIVLNLATEAFDFIDALFDALPKSCQDKAKPTIDYGRKGGGKADPYAKATAIWDCFGEIDWNKFTNNFINQQLTDMAVGMIGMTAGRYLKLTGQATGSGGLASKPTATADDFLEGWVDQQVEAGNITDDEGKAILEAGKLPIPQVEYSGDGTWTVNIEAWGLTFE